MNIIFLNSVYFPVDKSIFIIFCHCWYTLNRSFSLCYNFFVKLLPNNFSFLLFRALPKLTTLNLKVARNQNMCFWQIKFNFYYISPLISTATVSLRIYCINFTRSGSKNHKRRIRFLTRRGRVFPIFYW